MQHPCVFTDHFRLDWVSNSISAMCGAQFQYDVTSLVFMCPGTVSLQNLLNNFDVRQAGYDVVRRALQCMTNVAHHTNEMKRRHERAVHIQEVQSLLVGWSGDDLTTYGDLLLEVRDSGAGVTRTFLRLHVMNLNTLRLLYMHVQTRTCMYMCMYLYVHVPA